MASYGIPIVIDGDSNGELLQRVDFKHEFDEAWIQELVREHPHLLPIHEFELGCKQVISVGREAQTLQGGWIDNLFVTPEGSIIVVETKLWRNPEARREVIAQIIDYAQDMTNWTYENFNEIAIRYAEEFLGGSMDLAGIVRSVEPDFDEVRFHDNLMRNIKDGRFVLLIVGDGIQEGVENMVSFLQEYATIHFSLALVELRIFKRLNGEILVIPRPILKTKEIQRATITIRGAASATVDVTMDASLEVETQTTSKPNLNRDSFFAELAKSVTPEEVRLATLLQKEFVSMGYEIGYGKQSFSVRCETGKGTRTLSGFGTNGDLWIQWGYFASFGMPESDVTLWNAELDAMFSDLPEDTYIRLRDLLPRMKEFIALIDKARKQIVMGNQAKKK